MDAPLVHMSANCFVVRTYGVEIDSFKIASPGRHDEFVTRVANQGGDLL